MSLVVKASGETEYTPHPEGQYAARCIDVVDMGWQQTDFGPKYKLRVVFYCGRTEEREYEDGKRTVPLTVVGFFTASLHEKANLRKFTRAWRGRDFTDAELDGFDFEKMVGAPAFIQVEHNHANGKTYANIASIMRLPEGQTAPDTPADYVRVKDREDWPGPAPHPDMEAGKNEPDPSEGDSGMYEPDDDLPF